MPRLKQRPTIFLVLDSETYPVPVKSVPLFTKGATWWKLEKERVREAFKRTKSPAHKAWLEILESL